MTVGEKIKYYRNIRGISQEMLGNLSGINPATIKKYEYGIRNPKPDQLLKITNALGISINLFMDFDIETVSDVLSLLFKLDEQVDMRFEADKDENGEFIPKIKISENTEKITNPGNKTIYRVYEKETGKIKADLICFADETYDESQDLLLFDPLETWKKTKLAGGTYTMREMLVPIFENGECIYTSPSVTEIAEYCKQEKDSLWDETKRLFYPHRVYVDLSQRLYDVKKALLDQAHKPE